MIIIIIIIIIIVTIIIIIILILILILILMQLFLFLLTGKEVHMERYFVQGLCTDQGTSLRQRQRAKYHS